MNRPTCLLLSCLISLPVIGNAALAADAPCPTLEITGAYSGDAVALASTGDTGVEVQTASVIPVEGGEWKAEKPVGNTGNALTKFAVTPSGSEVVALLWHTLTSDNAGGSAATDGHGNLKLRLVGPHDGPPSATVTVDTYRTILPSNGLQGSLNLDGTDYSLTEARVEHVQHTYTVNVGDLLPELLSNVVDAA